MDEVSNGDEGHSLMTRGGAVGTMHEPYAGGEDPGLWHPACQLTAIASLLVPYSFRRTTTMLIASELVDIVAIDVSIPLGYPVLRWRARATRSVGAHSRLLFAPSRHQRLTRTLTRSYFIRAHG